ncbi:MAG: hypothetical protein SGJ27_31485 [Candidatus Melainabacteria bacterium]|nr:hypothetical protein [Candidatus Melainabacteria bacterium]
MPNEFGLEGDSNSTRNVLVTTRDVLAQTPSKIYEELQADLANPGKIATVAVVSTGVGFGTTAMLSKFPKAGPYVIAGLAGYQAVRYAGSTLDFLGEASHANTDFQRRLLVERAASGIGREGAMMIEGTPGLILGGGLATKMVGTPPAFKAIGSWSERNVGRPLSNATSASKEFVSEQWAFRGPGRMPLPANILSQEGKVNALELSEMLVAKHPWRGVETGRSIDLLGERVSKPLYGKATSLDPGFPDKPGRILFHTHGPESSVGTRPGLFDLKATQDVGIISRGNQTAFFVGQGREFNAALAAGTERAFAPKLQTLVLDSERKSAFILESMWQPELAAWQPALPKFVDYKTARSTLTKLDVTKPWPQIQQIPALPSIRGHNVDLSALNWLRTGAMH